ncbi:MAG: ABC transporter ATP-binding protein [Chloroflexi bacterium]|nr:ABC transporter ATP-binding protein [Chloroflexota bacterium]
MSRYSVEVNNIGKRYRIGAAPASYRTFRETLMETLSNPKKRLHGKMTDDNSFWALDDISFRVNQGEAVGIIGRNGAGKSTLLKVLSRITEPTKGEARIVGKVGSLLEVGTGFHPELTGRENIYLNGAILGMKRSLIDSKLDEIIAFSEVETFIDTPVKRYSSGMYLRLAFSVAAHLEPEILIVDEVLAVGDAEFQRKCLGKMSNVAGEGRTVLFVSHNMSAILRLTTRTLVLEKGKLELDAPSPEAVDYYLMSGFTDGGEKRWRAEEIPAATHPFMPVALRILNENGSVSETIRSTEAMAIEFEYELLEAITGLRVGIYLLSTRGEFIFTSFDVDDESLFTEHSVREKGTYISRCYLPADLLNEGRYVIGINASTFRIKRYFHDEQAISFNVDATAAPGTQWAEARTGMIRPKLRWEIEEITNAKRI